MISFFCELSKIVKIWPPRYAFKIQVRQLVEVDVGRRGEMARVVSHLKEGHGTWDQWEHDDFIYPLVMLNVAIENGHRTRGFSH